MTIDLFTLIWDSPDRLGPHAAGELRKRCVGPWEVVSASPELHEESAGAVDLSVVHGFDSAALGACISGESVARLVATRPGRLLGFAGIDASRPDALARLEEARALGLVGVSVAPSAQDLAPGDPRMLRLCEACEHLRLPVYVWSAHWLGPVGSLDHARPIHWDPVARRFPELRLVVGQLGWPWVEETALLVARHAHLHADVSGLYDRPATLHQALTTCAELRVLDRLFFASGFPLASAAEALAALRQLDSLTRGTAIPRLERRRLDQVIHRDALADLALASPVLSSSSRGA